MVSFLGRSNAAAVFFVASSTHIGMNRSFPLIHAKESQ